ncbi:MAG: amidase [Haloarculaceae archaeon]
MTRDTCFTPATELASAVRAGERSPVAVVEAFLDRIEARNGATNAYVTVCADRARERAREVEAAVERGDDPGPLAGVPVGVKDLLDVAGVRTTLGSRAIDRVPETSSIAVQRVEAAGGVVLGKTNTPEFGRKTNTVNPRFGATTTPFGGDAELTAGGSSGGSAAALADGLAALALGTDAAGSLRVPASACGVVGVVPDFGRVPQGPTRTDAFRPRLPYSYVGPMARTVGDAALALSVLAGPHRRDPDSRTEPVPEYPDRAGAAALDGLRVAASADLGLQPVADPVRGTFEAAVETIGDAGATVRRAAPAFGDRESLHGALTALLRARYLGLYDDLRADGIDLLDPDAGATPEVVSRVEAAVDLPARAVTDAERTRTGAFDAVQECLTDHDLLVTPTTTVPPWPVDGLPEIDGEAVDPNHGWILTWPFNLTGHPAVSVPAGFVDGLPVGLQVVGRHGADADVLAAAAAFERASPWTDRYPGR